MWIEQTTCYKNLIWPSLLTGSIVGVIVKETLPFGGCIPVNAVAMTYTRTKQFLIRTNRILDSSVKKERKHD